MDHFLKYKLVLGQPQPGYRFKPGECIVNKNFAQEFREAKCTQDQYDGHKLVVLQNAADPKNGRESYHLLYNSPLKGGEAVPWDSIETWFLKAFVDLNFESCEHPEP
jgi:hypothetical protein